MVRQLDPNLDALKRRKEAAAEARSEMLRLAQLQRNGLATSFHDLLGDGGPLEETADEMIQTIREWRNTPSNRGLD